MSLDTKTLSLIIALKILSGENYNQTLKLYKQAERRKNNG